MRKILLLAIIVIQYTVIYNIVINFILPVSFLNAWMSLQLWERLVMLIPFCAFGISTQKVMEMK